MVKLIRNTILSVCVLVCVVGLDTVLAAPPYQSESRLFPYSADGLTYGYVDETGQWVIQPQYDFAGDFAEALAVVELDGQYGYVDANGQEVVAPQYDFAGDFAFGLAPVVVDGEFGYIDQSGKIVIEPQFGDAHPFTAEGLAAVRPDETYGYVEQDGQFVIEPQFESAFSFSEGLAAIAEAGKYGFIDESGQVVIEAQFDFASHFAEGLAAVYVDGKMGYIDDSGTVVIEPVYDFADSFSEGLAAVRIDGQVGFIDDSGQMVIEPIYDFAHDFSEGLAAVREEELTGFIDASGQMVITPQFAEAGSFQDGLARVEWTTEWGVIDQSGTPAFQLPVAAIALDTTLVIPYLPGVPAESRDGICLPQAASSGQPSGWRCIVRTDSPNAFAESFSCLAADDGQSIVCDVDPLVTTDGFRVNLIESLPNLLTDSDAALSGQEQAWQVQLADGTICRHTDNVPTTVNNLPVSFTCSDGSVLLGAVRPGAVWAADRVALTDIAPTARGYEAELVNPADIAVVWQPANPATVLDEIGLSATGFSINPDSIGETVTPHIRPAVPANPLVESSGMGEPAHLRLAFGDETQPGGSGILPDHAQLRIYPVAAFRQSAIADRIAALESVLQERPESIEGELPLLSASSEGDETVYAQLKYLDFAGGTGVRYLTHFGVDAAPVTDHNTFYTFQGLTNDGQFVVVFFHPVPTDLLAGDAEEIAELVGDEDTFEENFEDHLQEIRDRLNQADPTDFAPNLDNLDSMLETIELQPEPEGQLVWVHQVEVQEVNGEDQATIIGDYPDGCSTLGEVVTEVDGNTINVTVYADRPPDAMCTMALVPFEETITLDVGDLAPDEYTVIVNESATDTLTVN
jgi:hypothetical protein